MTDKLDPQGGYRAICFDLDGTLLPMDIDEFMSAYFKRIAGFMAAHGAEPHAFMAALKAGTQEMAKHADGRTNEQAFWDTFFPVYEETTGIALTEEARADMRALSREFYETDFPHIGDVFEADPASARAVDALVEKDYPLVLATMPMFPRRAVEHRLAWAGVDPAKFARITCYENATSVKPRQTYFSEVLAAIGVPGSEVLMVGNNTMEDMAVLDLGVEGYLVTDWLLDPVSFDLSTIKHGSLEEFAAWAEALPACAHPAQGIRTDVISQEESLRVLEDNAVVPIDLEEAARKAALVADAVTGEHAPGDAASLRAE